MHFILIIDKLNINWVLFVHRLLSVILAHFLGVAFFLLAVKEGSYLCFVASATIAVYALVLIWMVKALDGCMTLVAQETVWAELPAFI